MSKLRTSTSDLIDFGNGKKTAADFVKENGQQLWTEQKFFLTTVIKYTYI